MFWSFFSTFCVWLFFCFKQKTAYEMRISDWSSDVCSSDLRGVAVDHPGAEIREGLRIVDRAAVMGGDAQMFGREAEGDGDVEIAERLHLPVEPVDRIGTEAVGPADRKSGV